MLSRADLQIARMELAILAKQYGLTRATRFINMLQVAGINTSDNTLVPQSNRAGAARQEQFNGFEIDFEIPIYDFGRARTRLAEESLYAGRQSAHREGRQRALRSAMRRIRLTAARTTSPGHFDKEILPLREIISQQELLNYNGMLTDRLRALGRRAGAHSRQRAGD